ARENTNAAKAPLARALRLSLPSGGSDFRFHAWPVRKPTPKRPYAQATRPIVGVSREPSHAEMQPTPAANASIRRVREFRASVFSWFNTSSLEGKTVAVRDSGSFKRPSVVNQRSSIPAAAA